MIIPTKRLIFFLLIGIPLALLPLFNSEVGTLVWILYLVLLAIILLLEYSIFPSLKNFNCEVHTESSYYIEAQHTISIKITSPCYSYLPGLICIVENGIGKIYWAKDIHSQIEKSATEIKTRKFLAETQNNNSTNKLVENFFSEIEEKTEEEYFPTRVTLSPGENKFEFSFFPIQRGKIEFSEVRLRILGYLGLWWFQRYFKIKKESNIIPNIRAVGKYALQFFSNQSIRQGIKIEKYRGEGTEFDSMKEYVPGMDTRSIDWKASLRSMKIICREFRAERNHQVIFALDCGRLMAAQFKHISKLDYAINSLMILAYYAIKSGDLVGFMAFSNQVSHYIKPQSNLVQLDKICHACNTISYNFQESNYVVSMEYLLSQQKRRSLIIIFTDFIDTISSELFKDYLSIMTRQHLVLFVAIRDPFLDEKLQQTPEILLDMHQHLSCYYLKEERVKLISELRRLGIHCLDLLPNQISIPVLNQYMEIRRREMI